MNVLDSPFQQLLGAQFQQLPLATQQLHGAQAAANWSGRAEVQRGRSVLARCCGWLARLPPAAEQVPIQVDITTLADGSQHWRRQFSSALMPSRLSAAPPWLREDLGAVTLWFALCVQEGGIDWRVARVRVLRMLPLPARWFAQVHAWSGADVDGRYRFVVHAQLPLLGLLVRYTGWLAPSEVQVPDAQMPGV